MALVDRVIASHYAEPVERRVAACAVLLDTPSPASEKIRSLTEGERFLMLDETLGWAWGYAAGDRRVGYVRSGALAED